MPRVGRQFSALSVAGMIATVALVGCEDPADGVTSEPAAEPVSLVERARPAVPVVPEPPPPAPPPEPPPISAWRVSQSTSPMDDSEVVVLQLDAQDVYLDWLGRPHRPTLILRCQSKKTEAYINNGGPSNPELGNFDQATIRLRYDDGAPRTLLASESTDDDALFLPNATAEIRRMIKAQRLRYQFTPFNANPQVVEFDLRGLEDDVVPLQEACGWQGSRRDEASRRRHHDAVVARRLQEEEQARQMAAAMPGWHPTYRREIAPVRAAVGAVTAAWTSGGTGTPECAALRDAIARVDRGRLTAAPDPVVGAVLSRLLSNFEQGAVHCAAGLRYRAEASFGAATRQWAELVRRLRGYGLEP